MKLTIDNISQFFKFIRTPPNRLRPGMLAIFDYDADVIHDKRPLIWVLEVKGDRIWGLNLHYDFRILGNIIEFKNKILEKEIRNFKQKQQEEKLKKDTENKSGEEIPTVTDAKIKNLSNSSIPEKLLEDYSEYPMGKNSHILRNYLYKRMRNTYRLSLKLPK